MDLMFGTGISREGGLIDVGVEQGFVRKAGAWYTYEGDQLGQGKENARAFLRDNPDLADELEKRIKEKLGIGAAGRRTGGAAGRRAGRHLTVARPSDAGGSGVVPAGPTPGSLADAGPEPDPESVARTILLRRLAAAPRTRAQLAADLAARDVPGDAAERVLDRFTEVGLIDDAAFADDLGAHPARRARAVPQRAAPRAARQGRRRRDGRRRARRRSTSTTRPRRPGRWWPAGCRPPAACRGRPGCAGWSASWPARATPAGWRWPVVREALAAEGEDERRSNRRVGG